jgi:hypothetical protein
VAIAYGFLTRWFVTIVAWSVLVHYMVNQLKCQGYSPEDSNMMYVNYWDLSYCSVLSIVGKHLLEKHWFLNALEHDAQFSLSFFRYKRKHAQVLATCAEPLKCSSYSVNDACSMKNSMSFSVFRKKCSCTYPIRIPCLSCHWKEKHISDMFHICCCKQVEEQELPVAKQKKKPSKKFMSPVVTMVVKSSGC